MTQALERDQRIFNKGYEAGAAFRQSRSKALLDIVERSYRRGMTEGVVNGEHMTDLIELPMTRSEAGRFREILSNMVETNSDAEALGEKDSQPC